MSDLIHDWASKLNGEIARDANGHDVIRCPGPDHSLVDRSLSVWLDDDAPGGFTVETFSERDRGDVPRLKDYVREKVGAPAWKPNGKGNGKHEPKREIVAKYAYQDATGATVLIVNRTKPKGFAQQRPDGHGGFVWGGIGELAKVPFMLPELIERIALGERVFVVEGEKSAQALWKRGFPATCSPGGAGKWPDHFAKWFEGAEVIILPDNDEPGRKHAERVRLNLEPVAASLKVINLPGLIPGGDVFDFMASGGNPAKIADLPDAEPKAGPPPRSPPPRAFRADELQQMDIPPPKEIVPVYVAAGLTLLVGKMKVRKSWLALDLCLGVARGGSTLDQKCVEGDVLYCALEDGPRRLKIRVGKIISTLGLWPNRLTFWTELERLDAGGEDRLRAWLTAHPEARLIVIDTFGMVRASRQKDEDWYSWDYRSARQFKALADEFEVAILAVHHANKGQRDDPLEATSGTNGLAGAADATLVLNKGGDGATLYGRSRDLEDVEVAVEFDGRTCRWSVLGEAREVRQSDQRKQILSALREANGPTSVPELLAETGMKSPNLRQLLRSMTKGPEALVERDGRGRYIPSRSQRSQAHNESDDEALYRGRRA